MKKTITLYFDTDLLEEVKKQGQQSEIIRKATAEYIKYSKISPKKFEILADFDISTCISGTDLEDRVDQIKGDLIEEKTMFEALKGFDRKEIGILASILAIQYPSLKINEEFCKELMKIV